MVLAAPMNESGQRILTGNALYRPDWPDFLDSSGLAAVARLRRLWNEAPQLADDVESATQRAADDLNLSAAGKVAKMQRAIDLVMADVLGYLGDVVGCEQEAAAASANLAGLAAAGGRDEQERGDDRELRTWLASLDEQGRERAILDGITKKDQQLVRALMGAPKAMAAAIVPSSLRQRLDDLAGELLEPELAGKVKALTTAASIGRAVFESLKSRIKEVAARHSRTLPQPLRAVPVDAQQEIMWRSQG